MKFSAILLLLIAPSFGRLSDPATIEVKTENMQWLAETLGRLENLKKNCGVLCEINDMAAFDKHVVAREPNRLEAPVDCNSLFDADEIDAGDITLPFPPPKELMPFYTMNGAIEFQEWNRFNNIYLGGEAKANVWSESEIEDLIIAIEKGTAEGTYGDNFTKSIRDYVRDHFDVKGQSVLVIGSERPWLESIALWAGAAHVTTLEYGSIESQHPKISTHTPETFRKDYKDGSLPMFDRVMSVSSLEHSGLGRYGDALNPWGDVLSLARVWCVTKPEGQMLLEVPVKPDSIAFNGNRFYGNIRYPLLTINWKNIDGTTDYLDQRGSLPPPHVFEKVVPQ